jgi:choline kinase
LKSLDLKKLLLLPDIKVTNLNNLRKFRKLKTKNGKQQIFLAALICADKILSKYTCIISYADIFYEKEAIQILNRSKKRKGIVLLSYKHWKKYWKKRFTNPLSDLETFVSNNKNELVEIGNRTNSYKKIKGQYMGVFRIDPLSWNKIKQVLFKDVKNLNKIDITALFQLIIKQKICNIYVENYEKKWFEIDNIKDYKISKKSIEN